MEAKWRANEAFKSAYTELYPNHLQDVFTLQSSGWEANERVIVRLYHLNGVLVKELYNGMLATGELQLEVNEALQAGLYIVELSSASKKEVKRLVKS